MKRIGRLGAGYFFFGWALSSWAQTPPDHSKMDSAKMHPGDASPGVASGGHMERHFDDAEQWAKEFDDPTRDQWQMPDKVLAALGLKRGQTVADLGAGTGYFTVRLAKSAAAPKVYAVDIEASMIAYLRKRASTEGLKNIVAVQASPESANLPEPVDLILIVDTYHHIPDREVYFRKLASSLKPQGRLAIIDWRRGGPMGPPEEFRFAPEQIHQELAKAGFKPIAHYDFLPNQLFLIFSRSNGK
ncbi:Methyltransferase type 11 [Candidatus Sulfotelmatobacter sp. SbA7]|nr:Methyltransferase type 11 [Candidatus Sulfotelmatobacter sp. SbA7]